MDVMRARARIKSALLASMASLGIALGCSGSGGGNVSCTAKGLCPNDTPPTPSDITQCDGLVGDPKCGGLFQSYYNCAYAQQQCATDGTLDGTATQTAIEAHCAPQVAEYQSCSGTTSTTQMHTCGYEQLPCCTSGPACTSTLCCDPTSNQCIGSGSACTATNSICVASTCEACGAAGQPCCPTFGMPNPDPCPAGGCCHYTQPGGGVCIADGGQCDVPDDGGAAVICHAGSCAACGSMGGPCCANATCTESGTLCSGGTCVDCNGIGQPPCP